MIKVVGIRITDRIKEAGHTQEILSRHASVITTRLGFHELTDEICSREACIILHLNSERAGLESLLCELNEIGGIELREMNFGGEEYPHDQNQEEFQLKILGILVERNEEVIKDVQRLLTAYGCIIRTRLGVNEDFFDKPAGLIIMELRGDRAQMDLLEKDLRSVRKVHVQKMVF